MGCSVGAQRGHHIQAGGAVRRKENPETCGERHDERARQCARASLDLARKSGDSSAVFHALLSKQASLRIPEDLDAAIELASEAVDLATMLRGPTRVLSAYEARIPLLFLRGDLAAADTDIAAAEAIANRIGSPAHLYAVKRFVLARALGDARLDDVAELAPSVMALGEQIGDEGARHAADQVAFFLGAASGELCRHPASFGPLDEKADEKPAVSAYFYLLSGDLDRCRQAFERAAQIGFAEVRRCEDGWLWHLCGCADVAATFGDRERAAVLYELIAPHAHVNVMNRLYIYRGSAAGVLGRLAHLLGRRQEARALLEDALEFNQRIGNAPSVVWVKVLLAQVLRAGSSRERKRSEKILARLPEEAATVGLGSLIAAVVSDLPPVPNRTRPRRRGV